MGALGSISDSISIVKIFAELLQQAASGSAAPAAAA